MIIRKAFNFRAETFQELRKCGKMLKKMWCLSSQIQIHVHVSCTCKLSTDKVFWNLNLTGLWHKRNWILYWWWENPPFYPSILCYFRITCIQSIQMLDYVANVPPQGVAFSVFVHILFYPLFLSIKKIHDIIFHLLRLAREEKTSHIFKVKPHLPVDMTQNYKWYNQKDTCINMTTSTGFLISYKQPAVFGSL